MTQVRLRRLAAADGAQVLAWRNAPEVARHMYGDHAIGEAEHARWLAAVLADPARRYWVVEVDGVPAGVAHVVDLESAHGRAEWGSYLADPALRGRGLGSAAAYLVLRWAFETAGVRKLWVEVLAENTVAWRRHLEFGFTREATFRAHVVKGGEPKDALGFGLLAAEWPAARVDAEARLQARGLRLDDLSLEP